MCYTNVRTHLKFSRRSFLAWILFQDILTLFWSRRTLTWIWIRLQTQKEQTNNDHRHHMRDVMFWSKIVRGRFPLPFPPCLCFCSKSLTGFCQCNSKDGKLRLCCLLFLSRVTDRSFRVIPTSIFSIVQLCLLPSPSIRCGCLSVWRRDRSKAAKNDPLPANHRACSLPLVFVPSFFGGESTLILLVCSPVPFPRVPQFRPGDANPDRRGGSHGGHQMRRMERFPERRGHVRCHRCGCC